MSNEPQEQISEAPTSTENPNQTEQIYPITASELQSIFDRIVKGFIAGDPALTLIQQIGNRNPLK